MVSLKLTVYLFAALPALAALPGGVQWEVRTGGSDVNGGGFVSGASGTDRSQSDAAFCTSADLATVGTAATSAACPFSAASVGNLIQITAGGCSAGFYQVVSVAVVTATLDRSAGTASGCTFALGGGLLTLTANLTALVSSNVTWIKSGTYTVTAAVTIPAVSQGVLSFIGYQSTHGDASAQPLITTATNSVNLFQFAGIGGYVFRNLSISSTAGTRGDAFLIFNATMPWLQIDLCTIDGTKYGVEGNFQTGDMVNNLVVSRTEIKNTTTGGIINNQNTLVYGCFIHDSAGVGVELGNSTSRQDGSMIVVRSVLYKNSIGLRFNLGNAQPQHSFSVYSSVFSDNVGDGVQVNTIGTVNSFVSVNSIYYANGGFGVSLSANPGPVLNLLNAYGANVSGARSNFDAGAGDVTLTADPFVSRNAGNFALNSTAGGGAGLKAIGYPGTIPGAGAGFADVGALQTAGGGGGGGGSKGAYVQ